MSSKSTRKYEPKKEWIHLGTAEVLPPWQMRRMAQQEFLKVLEEPSFALPSSLRSAVAEKSTGADAAALVGLIDAWAYDLGLVDKTGAVHTWVRSCANYTLRVWRGERIAFGSGDDTLPLLAESGRFASWNDRPAFDMIFEGDEVSEFLGSSFDLAPYAPIDFLMIQPDESLLLMGATGNHLIAPEHPIQKYATSFPIHLSVKYDPTVDRRSDVTERILAEVREALDLEMQIVDEMLDANLDLVERTTVMRDSFRFLAREIVRGESRLDIARQTNVSDFTVDGSIQKARRLLGWSLNPYRPERAAHAGRRPASTQK